MKKKHPPKLIGESVPGGWILRLRVGSTTLIATTEVDSEIVREFDTRSACVRAAKRLAERLGCKWEVAE